ncbi:MAG TPA: hypothetical protein VFL72_00675, partial [Acidimicrobiia bacterium]|nr:hypothetical protein [Acidimicrobiia bacterium]
MPGLLLVVGGAVLSALAFPRIGPGWLILPGIALFLAGLRTATNRVRGLALGAVYGLVFYGCLLWWFVELGLVAVIPLVLLQTSFVTAYAWWLARYNDRSPGTWFVLAVGGWAIMELIRYRIPFGGFEWGAAGYALSDQAWARYVAPIAGTTGITVLVVAVAALVVLEVTRSSSWVVRVLALLPLLFVILLSLTTLFESTDMGPPVPVAIVQGSTPCPFEHCPPDERLRTFQQHLELTKTIDPG